MDGTYLQYNGIKTTDWFSVMEKYGEWCADAELDACCEWLDNDIGEPYPTDLRNGRRLQDKIAVIINGISYQLTDEQQKQLNQIITSNATD